VLRLLRFRAASGRRVTSGITSICCKTRAIGGWTPRAGGRCPFVRTSPVPALLNRQGNPRNDTLRNAQMLGNDVLVNACPDCPANKPVAARALGWCQRMRGKCFAVPAQYPRALWQVALFPHGFGRYVPPLGLCARAQRQRRTDNFGHLTPVPASAGRYTRL
jgi:hypothetical protein